ncbi:MAG: hypothetical protein AB4290_01125 [Spirulina sp.]
MSTEIILEIPFDAIALDRHKNVVLLIQVKPKPYKPEREIEFFLQEIKDYLKVSKKLSKSQ